jgi:hypothetical protein
LPDKSSQLILDALSRAALHPEGAPLHGSKSTPGLFPTSAAARQAAQHCKDEGLLRVVSTHTRGKAMQETCAITDRGQAHLLSQYCPKQMLEVIVRALEGRQGQLAELIATARQMQLGIDALRNVGQTVLDQVRRQLHTLDGRRISSPAASTWQDAVLGYLGHWHNTGTGEDCPLPTLYQQTVATQSALTIGQFHDGLRVLHNQNRIYLHPWTGPLYDMPEPSYALLIGHEVLYFASLRQPASRGVFAPLQAADEMPSYEYQAGQLS